MADEYVDGGGCGRFVVVVGGGQMTWLFFRRARLGVPEPEDVREVLAERIEPSTRGREAREEVSGQNPTLGFSLQRPS